MAVGTLMVTSIAMSPNTAQANPFVTADLVSGYQLSAGEGKCGEGKCGGDKAKKSDMKKKEGKCGEGKCGGSK